MSWCIDETPTRQAAAKARLWSFVTPRFTTFAIRPTRAATVLTEHLTDRFAGVVGCDRAKMYWSLGRLQWCWAHLKRDFQALIDHDDGRVRRLGHDLMRQTKGLFGLRGDRRQGKLSRADWTHQMGPIRRAVEDLLLRGRFSGHPRLVGMCRELHTHRAWLWSFLEVEGVEPTNNASQRALRHAVIWSKLSFGTQSERGSRFVERMLTVVETCRQQSRSVLSFVTEAVEARYANRSAPSLRDGV